jgi:hypothetical protein
VAPGDLEQVRELLNSWLISNDTRVVTDRFAGYARDHGVRRSDIRRLRELRDDLRAAVECAPGAASRITEWPAALDPRPVIRDGGIAFEHPGGLTGDILAIVLAAAADGRWRRLKACPDCRWVFYDHTRNASKRWCLMYAGGPDGRACGTIAKVRRYRQKTSAASPPGGRPSSRRSLDHHRGGSRHPAPRPHKNTPIARRAKGRHLGLVQPIRSASRTRMCRPAAP